MSPPDTDVEKQAKRHRGPLYGTLAVVVFALALLVGLIFWVVGTGNEPREAEHGAENGPAAEAAAGEEG
jgi:hypothetical protein